MYSSMRYILYIHKQWAKKNIEGTRELYRVNCTHTQMTFFYCTYTINCTHTKYSGHLHSHLNCDCTQTKIRDFSVQTLQRTLLFLLPPTTVILCVIFVIQFWLQENRETKQKPTNPTWVTSKIPASYEEIFVLTWGIAKKFDKNIPPHMRKKLGPGSQNLLLRSTSYLY
jgi:hypothetical protein